MGSTMYCCVKKAYSIWQLRHATKSIERPHHIAARPCALQMCVKAETPKTTIKKPDFENNKSVEYWRSDRLELEKKNLWIVWWLLNAVHVKWKISNCNQFDWIVFDSQQFFKKNKKKCACVTKSGSHSCKCDNQSSLRSNAQYNILLSLEFGLVVCACVRHVVAVFANDVKTKWARARISEMRRSSSQRCSDHCHSREVSRLRWDGFPCSSQ